MVLFFYALHHASLGMNEMAAGANRISMAVNRANAISGRNKENIDDLVREASNLKAA